MNHEQRIQELKNLIARSPRRGTLTGDVIQGVALHPSCGDEIVYSARIENTIITNIAVAGEGCLLSKAAGILVADYAFNKSITEAAALSEEDIIARLGLGPVGPTRRRCVALAIEALRKLIQETA